MCRIPIDLLTERAPGSREFAHKERQRERESEVVEGRDGTTGTLEQAEPSERSKTDGTERWEQRRMDVGRCRSGLRETKEEGNRGEDRGWTYASEGGRVVMR